MRKNEMRNDTAGCVARLLLLAMYVVVCGSVCGVCWQYSVNFWLAYLGKEPALHFWQAFIIGIVPGLGQTSLLCAVVTFILSFFL